MRRDDEEKHIQLWRIQQAAKVSDQTLIGLTGQLMPVVETYKCHW
jgi:ABC-type phosphate transport system ATPase subunit